MKINSNYKNKISEFFGKNKIILIIGLGIIILLILFLTIRINNNGNNKDNKLLYDRIENVKIEDINDLAQNVTDIACVGGLNFNIKIGTETQVIDASKDALLSYLFKYLERKNLLSDKMDKKFIQNACRNLFYDEDLLLFNSINNFRYGDYIYNIKDDVVVRTLSKCEDNNFYVSRLFGHTNTDTIVSMDVDIGKLVNGELYDMTGNKLGNYSGENIELYGLFSNAPYYRYNFVKVNGIYKLKSIQLISRNLD